MRRINKKYFIVGLLLLLIIDLSVFFTLLERSGPLALTEKTRIIFLDVGQGDATLIQTSQGQNILIDGGPDKGIIYKLDQYVPFYQRTIDLMILTHPDPDHLNGLIEVLNRYKVKSFLFNGVNDQSIDYDNFLQTIDYLSVNKEVVWQGKKINFDNGSLNFIFPFENLIGQDLKDDNDGSLVFQLILGDKKILFASDASQKIEQELIDKKIDISADILKVGHHGSKSSSSLNFLYQVKPKQAVISVSQNNKYGHPNLRVLKNLVQVGARVLRTDQLGDIIFEFNGLNLIKK